MHPSPFRNPLLFATHCTDPEQDPGCILVCQTAAVVESPVSSEHTVSNWDRNLAQLHLVYSMPLSTAASGADQTLMSHGWEWGLPSHQEKYVWYLGILVPRIGTHLHNNNLLMLGTRQLTLVATGITLALCSQIGNLSKYLINLEHLLLLGMGVVGCGCVQDTQPKGMFRMVSVVNVCICVSGMMLGLVGSRQHQQKL